MVRERKNMFNYNSYMIRYHNDYFKLSCEDKSLYKAENFNTLKKELQEQCIINKKIKTHPFESFVYEENNINNINDFLLSIGEDKVVVNNDPNSLLFKNLLDYDMFNYKTNYKKEYIFDLPYTEIKTLSENGNINYKFSSIVYYLIDKIYEEILSNKELNINEEELNEFISDYLPTLYSDTLVKTKNINKAFLFKTYENERSINNVLIPNENILEKVNFYQFNNFIKENLINDLSEIKELKNYHKKQIINFIKNKNNNVVFLRRR